MGKKNHSGIDEAAVTSLGQAKPFANLEPQDLSLLAARARLVTMHKNESLSIQGGEPIGLVVVDQGELAVELTSAVGRRLILAILRAGSVYPCGSLTCADACPVRTLATRASRVHVISRADIDSLIRQSPELALAFVRVLDRRIGALIGSLELATLHPIDHCVAAFLARQARARGCQNGHSHRLPRDLTTETLGARLGTVREELARSLKRLGRHGFLELDRNTVLIMNVSALENFLQGIHPAPEQDKQE